MTLAVVGILDSVLIADVASSYASNAVQVVHFPFPANGEVTEYVTSSHGTECRKATTFSVAKCLEPYMLRQDTGM